MSAVRQMHSTQDCLQSSKDCVLSAADGIVCMWGAKSIGS